MIKCLIPDRHAFRANLHCHTTCSDGKYTPREIKDVYRSLGIPIVAFSDHHHLVDHTGLTDESFLALNAFEFEVPICGNPSPWFWNPLIHIGMIAKTPETRLDKPIQVDGFGIDSRHRHEELVSAVNAAIHQAQAQNFLCILNHPEWSMLSIGDALDFRGLIGIEVRNHASTINTGIRENDSFFNQMVSGLARCNPSLPFPYAIAADDNHARIPVGRRDCQNGGGWLEVFSDSLSYPAVVSALESGAFYASSGAKIKSLEYDPGNRTVHVQCSPASFIRIFSRGRISDYVAAEPGRSVQEATFQLDPQLFHSFFRIRIEGIDGKEAWSNCFPI
ncbi:MAG: PHP domain-containing protein [Kiritimatiellia bacterium]